MIRYDLSLIQAYSSGNDFEEKLINITRGGVFTATTDINRGPRWLAGGTVGQILKINSSGDLEFAAQDIGHNQNTDTGTTGNTFTFDSDSVLGKMIISPTTGAANFSLTLTNAALSGSNKTITFPNSTGTVALTAGTTFTTAILTSPVIDDIKAAGIGSAVDLWSEVTTGNATLLTSQTTGNITIGGDATGSINIDPSTKTHNLNLGYGSTTTGLTKTVNVGTNGATGSTTAINIGTGGAGTATVNVNLGSSTGGITTVNKDLVVTGDLTVNGTTTTINTATISVDDKNIELGSVTSPTNVTADGGGITLRGATDKTIIWDNANGNWTLNQNTNISSDLVYKINNTTVLSSTQVLGVTLGTMAAETATNYVTKSDYIAAAPIYKSSMVLYVEDWNLVSGLYEIDLANANITNNSFVNIIPKNINYSTYITAAVRPYTLVSSGTVKIYATNLPSGEIAIDLLIMTVAISSYSSEYFARYFDVGSIVTATHLIDTSGNNRHLELVGGLNSDFLNGFIDSFGVYRPPFSVEANQFFKVPAVGETYYDAAWVAKDTGNRLIDEDGVPREFAWVDIADLITNYMEITITYNIHIDAKILN